MKAQEPPTLFLGIELLSELDSSAGRNESLFTAIASMARLVEAVLPALPTVTGNAPTA